MTPILHWSFDHSHTKNGGALFRDELLARLEETCSNATEHRRALDYIVLPNYWRGYAAKAPGKRDRLAFGEARIEREESGGRFADSVRYANDASGEDMRLTFETDGGPVRELHGAWRVVSRNSAGHGYRRFECDGARRRDEVWLTVNDVSFCAGRVEPGAPLLCNWALFDVIPALYASQHSFTALDDLEKLKPNSRLRSLGAWSYGKVSLRGFALQGVGQPPNYWWIDESGHVVLMTNTFHTFVLRSGEGSR